MKQIILLAIMLNWFNLALAQNYNDYVIAGQIGTSSLSTSSYDASLMLGMKTHDGDQFLIGPQFKQFGEQIGHKQSYLGGRVHAQTNISRFAPFLNVGFYHGNYYMFNKEGLMIGVKKRSQLNGTFGVGYMVHKLAGLFLGYSVQEYNPSKYYQREQSPYRSGAVSLKLSVNAPFGNGFTTGSIGQRRMW